MTETIPGPPGLPILGNLLDLQDDVPIHAFERLTDVYGPLFKVRLGGKEIVVAGGFDIFDELCDETKFWKVPPKQLTAGRKGAMGLFASQSEKDPDWGQAHRILMPAFGPIAIENMFDGAYFGHLKACTH